MKTLKMRWLPLFLLAALTFFFPACEKDKSSVDGGSSGEDATGMITLKMRNSENGETTIRLESGDVFITSANNFSSSYEYASKIEFSDMGTKKLSSIESVPTSGWASEVAVTPKHRYVIHNKYLRSDTLHKYYKLYVVDYTYSTSGGIIGAEVKYGEWDPNN